MEVLRLFLKYRHTYLGMVTVYRLDGLIFVECLLESGASTKAFENVSGSPLLLCSLMDRFNT